MMQEHVLKKYAHEKLPEILIELDVDDKLKQGFAEARDNEILNQLIEKKEYTAADTFLAL